MIKNQKRFFIGLCLWLVLVSYCMTTAGCTICRLPQIIEQSLKMPSEAHQNNERVSKVLVYQCDKHSVHVKFVMVEKQTGGTLWTMEVGEPNKYLHPDRLKQTNMDASISECSQKEYFSVLDGSLTWFHHLYPNARIERMLLGAYTVRQLWKEIRTEMQVELSQVLGNKVTMHDPKTDDLNEPPYAAWAAPNHVLQKSETVLMTRNIFRKHGFKITDVVLGTEFWFKESLNGRSWKEISRLSDVGIATPGNIEFDIQKRHIP